MLASWYLMVIVPCTAAAGTLHSFAACVFFAQNWENIVNQPAFILQEDLFFMKPV